MITGGAEILCLIQFGWDLSLSLQTPVHRVLMNVPFTSVSTVLLMFMFTLALPF